MSDEQLVRMANDIAHYFASEPDRAKAVAGVAGHLQRFWDPRMRRKLKARAEAGEEGLEQLVREAVAALDKGSVG